MTGETGIEQSLTPGCLTLSLSLREQKGVFTKEIGHPMIHKYARAFFQHHAIISLAAPFTSQQHRGKRQAARLA